MEDTVEWFDIRRIAYRTAEESRRRFSGFPIFQSKTYNTRKVDNCFESPIIMSDNKSFSSSSLDYQAILQTAKDAVHLAGAEIRRVWWQGDQTLTTKSNDVDLVTETDEKAEELITQLLQTKYPLHKIIGEETSGTACQYTLTDEPTWTIDPIDGTTNFVHRLGMSCVLLAFLVDKEVKVGVTYNPTTQELFWAIKGQGAYLETADGGENKRRIHVSQCKDIPKALIAGDCGIGRDEDSIYRFQSVQRGILKAGVRNLRAFGSTGICLAYVACGRFDAYFEEGTWETDTGPKIWDVSAGRLLIEEAGGVTKDITKRASRDKPMDILQRSCFGAATPELADKLLDIMYNTE